MPSKKPHKPLISRKKSRLKTRIAVIHYRSRAADMVHDAMRNMLGTVRRTRCPARLRSAFPCERQSGLRPFERGRTWKNKAAIGHAFRERTDRSKDALHQHAIETEVCVRPPKTGSVAGTWSIGKLSCSSRRIVTFCGESPPQLTFTLRFPDGKLCGMMRPR